LAMTIARGELRCLIGPNGAGKSTFFSLLTGLHKPDAGRVLFKGEDITYLPPFLRVRRGLSLKFQNVRIYRELTVRQHLLVAGTSNRDVERSEERRVGKGGRCRWVR